MKYFLGGNYGDKEWFTRFKSEVIAEHVDPCKSGCYDEYKLWDYIKKDSCDYIVYVLANDESCLFSASKLLYDVAKTHEKVLFAVLDKEYGGSEYSSPSGAISSFIDSIVILATSLGACYFTSPAMLLRRINGQSTEPGDDGRWFI